jgi:hypothetical protein
MSAVLNMGQKGVLVQNATVTNIVSKDQNERGNFLKSWAL